MDQLPVSGVDVAAARHHEEVPHKGVTFEPMEHKRYGPAVKDSSMMMRSCQRCKDGRELAPVSSAL